MCKQHITPQRRVKFSADTVGRRNQPAGLKTNTINPGSQKWSDLEYSVTLKQETEPFVVITSLFPTPIVASHL